MPYINLCGDIVLGAVNERLVKMDVLNDDLINSTPWLQLDKG